MVPFPLLYSDDDVPNRRSDPRRPPQNGNGRESASSSPGAIIAKERRVTSPGIALGLDISGEDYINQILSGSSDPGDQSRPLSAYIDIPQSYNQPGNRESRGIPPQDNPMQHAHAKTRNTVHTSTPSTQVSPMRRPSPTDMKNLEEFKKGRTSKRANGKTQV
jgi:hypothetical protein